jgi:hypothetical protein
MSVSLVRGVLERSRSEHAARLVMLVLAESAWKDGVTWRSQTQICTRAKLAERTVRDAIEDLVALGELEVRVAQDGRRRFYAYRVLVSKVEPVDYHRIPGTIAEPFDDRQDLPPVGATGDRQISAPDDRQNSVARLKNRKNTNRKRESEHALSMAIEETLLDVCEGANRRSGLQELKQSAQDICGYLRDDYPDITQAEAVACVSTFAQVLADEWSFGAGRVTPHALAAKWDNAAAAYPDWAQWQGL